MESSHLNNGELHSQTEYRRQLQNSITALTEQFNAEPTLQGKALIEDKLDQLKEQMGKVTEPKEISMQRIIHLEEIFKHYCTHIFRVGKHMTFDRLDYEKVHIGMDRFFKFLGDFGLTTATVDGRQRQVVSKNKIITVFKKVSSTSKDLSFEEFIECLEKLGPIYFDEKESYSEKAKIQSDRRRKVKENVEKRKAARKALNDPKNQSLGDDPQEQEPAGEAAQVQLEPTKKEEAENDDMVKEMMQNSQEIEHPAEEVDKIIKEKQQEIQRKIAENKLNGGGEDDNDVEGLNRNDSENVIGRSTSRPIQGQSDFRATVEEKVELFYKMIGVDNIKDYRNKLSELNLPLFKVNHHERKPSGTRETPQLLDKSEPRSDTQDEEALRLQKIKEKINEKKAMVKNQTQSPKKLSPSEENDIKRQQEERRLKKEKDKERFDKVKRLKDDDATKKQEPEKKKQSYTKQKGAIVFKESNVTWDGIEKMNFEQLNLKQFHPHNLYNLEPEDEEYMGQLKFDLKNLEKYRAMNRVREKKENDKSLRGSVVREKRQSQRIAQEKEKKVEAVVSSAKKRASELEKSEKTKQKNIDHLSRKLSQSKTPHKLKI